MRRTPVTWCEWLRRFAPTTKGPSAPSALLAQVTQASGTTQGPHGDRGVPSVRSVAVVGSRTCDVLPGRALRLAAAGRARDHRSIGDGLRGRAGSSAAVRHDGTRARRSISAIRPVGVPPKWSPPEVCGGDWLPPGSSSRSFRRGPAVAIVVRAVHGRTACRGHQSQHDHYGGHRGQPILSRCPRAQSRPVWPPSSGATTPPRPPSTGGSPPPTSTTSLARVDGHEQAPITEAARPLPDLHELTAPPKENEDRAGDGDCGLRPERLSLRARSPGLEGGVDACV